MKVFTPDTISRFLLFALICFFAADLLVYAVKEQKRIGNLLKNGQKCSGTFTDITSQIVKRKMRSSAMLHFSIAGQQIDSEWRKGFFDDEVLLFRNTDQQSLPVTVFCNPENPYEYVVEDCYNPAKHKLIIALCLISVCALGWCLLVI